MIGRLPLEVDAITEGQGRRGLLPERRQSHAICMALKKLTGQLQQDSLLEGQVILQ